MSTQYFGHTLADQIMLWTNGTILHKQQFALVKSMNIKPTLQSIDSACLCPLDYDCVKMVQYFILKHPWDKALNETIELYSITHSIHFESKNSFLTIFQ